MTARRPVATWPVAVLALPAFVAIWAGWVGLGELTGFGEIHPLPGTPLGSWTLNTAITLPIGVETYAAYALRVWLGAHPDLRDSPAVRFARASAVGSLVLGAAGQVAYHLMIAAHRTSAPWQITTLVACLPVAVLGMGAALAHLMHAADAHATSELAAAQASAEAAQEDAAQARAEAAEQTARADRTATELADARAHAEAAQAALDAAHTRRTDPARPARTPARTGRARQAHADSDLQRRTTAREGFEASVRAGTPWDNPTLACALDGCTPDCTPTEHRPAPARLRAASAAASRWRTAAESQQRTETAQ